MYPGPTDATVFKRETLLEQEERPAVSEATAALRASERAAAIPWVRVARAAIVVVAAAFYSIHFLHLSADFPNHSPWMDWSKYTDEGWYGDAAIRHLERGQWYVPGDFNPGAALPVWPLLEFLLFSVTGVSLVAARALTVAVFGCILVTAYVLMRRCARRYSPAARSPFAPAAAVLLLAVSPFCYAFTRLAILEPLLVLLGLLALLAASFAVPKPDHAAWRWFAPILGLGVLLPLMVLTKTTALFLFPAIAWMLWASTGSRVRELLRAGVPAAAIGAGLWAAYFAFLVRPRFLADYRYLFSANAYTGMTRENWLTVLWQTARDGMWVGEAVYPLAIAALVLALPRLRRQMRNPLVPSLMLWAVGYAGFLAYHNNLQPRYYLVIGVALTMLLPLVAEEAVLGLEGSATGVFRAAAALSGAALAVVAFVDARQTAGFVESAQYSFEEAAREVHGVVTSDRGHNPLVLSISGSDLSLMTGLPSICDDFGTMDLKDRAAAYRPGWYLAWNEVEDDKMEALAPLFHLVRVAAFPAFDDPERNLLILYRLDPPLAEVPRTSHRKAVPKLLQTKTGQQPSAEQLEH